MVVFLANDLKHCLYFINTTHLSRALNELILSVLEPAIVFIKEVENGAKLA